MKKSIIPLCFVFCLSLSGCKTINILSLEQKVDYSEIELENWLSFSQERDISSSEAYKNTIVDNPLHKFIFYKGADILPIEWTGALSSYEDFTRSKIYTNDLSWKIAPLLIFQASKDESTYNCYYCNGWWKEYLDYYWEDANNIFLNYNQIAVSKKDVPWFFPLQDLLDQDDWRVVWYSSGYIIHFPFKFPVDGDTFNTLQDKYGINQWEMEEIQNLRNLSSGDSYLKFKNGGIQYDKYLWDDKDWVYFWGFSYDPGSSSSFLKRIKKESDFKILQSKEIQKLVCYDDEIKLSHFTWEIDEKNWENLFPSFSEFPWVYYHDNVIYISRPSFWTSMFPIDWSTMKWEEKTGQKEGESTFFYNTLSDKNWRYWLVYYDEWDYFELQRVRK